MSEGANVVPGSKIENEVPPHQGVTLNTVESKDLKEGEFVVMMVKKPNQFSAVNQIYKVSHQDGKILLEPVDDDMGDPERRKELAKAIVESHKEEIMQEALVATENALERKPIEKLQKMQEEGKKGKKVKMGTQKGCVFLSIGEEEVVL